MAYTTINKSTDYFNTKLYTGNGSTQTISGVGHQPDLTWVKVRSETGGHRLADAVRGYTKYIFSNGTDAEGTSTTNITSWNSDGFALGNGSINENTRTYASWNWKANGAGSSNTDGSITSTVSANTTSGFSIVKWTGTGSSGTIGHGLGVAPKVVIVKRYSASADWVYYTSTIDGSMDYLYLNLTNAKVDSGNPVPTSSVFQKSDTNGETQIAYCFAEKTGYSKFGSYVGNGNADGTFIYTGFKPAFVMIKRTSNTDNWYMKDNKRSGTAALQNFGQMNPNQTQHPSANNSNAENKASAFATDILSNGFKLRGTDAGLNQSGESYIYMCFAEAPLVGTNNVPCTAR
jgi:hypothetical protein